MGALRRAIGAAVDLPGVEPKRGVADHLVLVQRWERPGLAGTRARGSCGQVEPQIGGALCAVLAQVHCVGGTEVGARRAERNHRVVGDRRTADRASCRADRLHDVGHRRRAVIALEDIALTDLAVGAGNGERDALQTAIRTRAAGCHERRIGPVGPVPLGDRGDRGKRIGGVRAVVHGVLVLSDGAAADVGQRLQPCRGVAGRDLQVCGHALRLAGTDAGHQPRGDRRSGDHQDHQRDQRLKERRTKLTPAALTPATLIPATLQVAA